MKIISRSILALIAASLLCSMSLAESEHIVYNTFKVKVLDSAGGDYRKFVILLHEAYDGANALNSNFAVGTLFAERGSTGAWNIKRAVQINTGSAYNTNHGGIASSDMDGGGWRLVTVTYLATKYLAIEAPYAASHMPGIRFEGFHKSTALGLKTIPYYNTQSSTVLNQEINGSIAPFVPTMTQTFETKLTRFGKDVEIHGNVGIGTANPQNKLDVNGAIRAKDLVVDSAWADHVFADGYALLPLAEVEAHIAANRRLPGVPSAEEVAANGVSIGESQSMLLEKVEELTLYAIGQERANEELRKAVADKDAELSALQRRTLRLEALAGLAEGEAAAAASSDDDSPQPHANTPVFR